MTSDVTQKVINANDFKNGTVVTNVHNTGVFGTIDAPFNKVGSAENLETALTNRFDDTAYFGVSSISTTDLKVWFKADSLTTLSDGDVVTTWSESSGNGTDATQSTTSKKPVYKTAILGGKPVVRFDGTDDFLSTTNVAIQSHCTVFVVASQTNSGTSNPFFFEHSANANSNDGFYAMGSNASSLFKVRRTGHHAYDSDGNWFGFRSFAIGAFVYDGALVTRKNGVAIASSVAGGSTVSDSSTTAGLFLGSRNGASLFFEGDLAELAIYNDALTTDQIQLVERSLAGKYKIDLSI